MTVEHVLSCGNEVGETPIWIPEEQALYWIDIEGIEIQRLDPATGEVESWTPPVPVTALARGSAPGRWLLATKEGLYDWNQADNTASLIVDPCADAPALRLNDGVVDRQGRFLVGTLNQEDFFAPDGALYCLGTDRQMTELDTGYAVANGIALSPDGCTLYVTDMFQSRIEAYDYDPATGTPSNRRTFATVPEADGYPDGLIVDAAGFVWSAHWGGSRVTRYAADGTIERTVELPVSNVTCMAFGGPDLTDLYITTAWFMLSEEEREAQPQAGDLFRVRTDIQGLVEPCFGG